ncbi:hypothetical protein DH2020_046372 [Rehmannia glutinosa]|uniref:ribonuclease P n=1 Tax=Rehmannia glutinosa TaxID=99300 RepID=A0ABR0UC97_REHGL
MNNHHNTRRKKQKLTPEAQFRSTLDHCSKTKNLSAAISLYESSASPALTLNNLNSFLYICSESLSDPETREPAIDFGFKLFHHHNSENFKPNEATLTAVARLAAAKGDGEYAFELAKSVKNYAVAPKLRTFVPALICFCGAGAADKAYEVEEYVKSVGLHLDEPELAALLKEVVYLHSIDDLIIYFEGECRCGKENKVYEYLHKLRGILRGVDESTVEIVESWFRGKKAADVGLVSFDPDRIKEAIIRNGGGWHGLGWLGEGQWVLCRSNIASDGSCCACGEQLVCVDIDRAETEKFAQSVASLAMERELQSNFKEFQDWLGQHSEYETVVDGANVGLYQQNFAEGGFSIAQLDAVVKEVHSKSKKLPLVILHKKRVRSLLEDASKRELIDEWMDQGVRYTFMKGNLKLIMPPSYSLVIQESEKGSWHVPIAGEVSDESLRNWLCVTRSGSHEAENISNKNHLTNEEYETNSDDVQNDARNDGSSSATSTQTAEESQDMSESSSESEENLDTSRRGPFRRFQKDHLITQYQDSLHSLNWTPTYLEILQ